MPTAINPQTGQRIEWDGKAWNPVGATGVMADTKVDQETLSDVRDQAQKSLYTATQAERFNRVRDKNNIATGGLAARPVVPFTKAIPGSPLWGDLISAATGNEGWDQLKSITSGLAPAQRIPGSGSSSDIDVRMFRESLPNIEASPAANVAIADDLKAKSTRENARASFLDTWYARNGTLLGADKAFNAWYPTYAKTTSAKPRPTAKPRPVQSKASSAGWKVISAE